jgi:hypothetical protein
MRKLMLAFGLAAGALTLAAGALSAQSGDEQLPADQHRSSELQQSYNGTKGGSALNMVAVGQNDLGGRGFNGDVFVHRHIAYVGRWGFLDPQHPQFCPTDSGIAVVDATNPASPVQVSSLNDPAASIEDVVVYTAAYGPLAGRDIAVGGLQYCASARTDPAAAGHRGLKFWDVTNPGAPVTLGVFDTGCCTRGVHEFEVGDRPDLGKTFVYASVPFAERPDPGSPSGVRDLQNRGEAWIVDVTDPRSASLVSTFGIKKDLGLDPLAGQGCFAISFGHGMNPSAEGKTLFVSYWDAGFIALDVTNPATPVFLGKTTYAASEDGDAHSTSYDNARKLLFTADEDFCKNGPGVVTGWGYLRVFDASNPRAMKQIGEYHTPNSFGLADPGAGDYVIHNPLVIGTDVYISWYTDGVRVVDAKNPRQPKEVAHFVPPAGQNPVKPAQRNVLTNTTQVWGVAYQDGLVYASDMNTGLWILKRTDK